MEHMPPGLEKPLDKLKIGELNIKLNMMAKGTDDVLLGRADPKEVLERVHKLAKEIQAGDYDL